MTQSGHQPPARHLYDLITVGDQFGAVASAAILAKRGFRVLHIPSEVSTTSYNYEGYTWPSTHSLLPRVSTSSLFARLVREIDLERDLKAASHEVAFQYVKPGMRLSLAVDQSRREKELRRVFKDASADFEASDEAIKAASIAADAVIDHLPDLHPRLPWQRWKLNKWIAQTTSLHAAAPPPFDAFLSVPEMFAAYVSHASPLTKSRTAGQLQSGVTHFERGRDGLTKLMLQRARSLGADIYGGDTKVESLSFSGPLPVSMKVTGKDATLHTTCLLVGMPGRSFAKLVPQSRFRRTDSLSCTHALMTLNALVPVQAIPPGLGECTIAKTPTQDGGAVLIELTPAWQADGSADKRYRMISFTTRASISLRENEGVGIRDRSDAVWEALGHMLPFTRSRAVLESSAWQHAPAVAAGECEPFPLYELPEDSTLGIAGVSLVTAQKNIFMANREVFPGLGFEGEILAALAACQRALSTPHLEPRAKSALPVHRTREL